MAKQLAESLAEMRPDTRLIYLRRPKHLDSSNKDMIKPANVEELNRSKSILSIRKLRKSTGEATNIILFGRNVAVVYFIATFFIKRNKNIIIWEGKSYTEARLGSKTLTGKYIIPFLTRVFYKKANYIVGISDGEVEDFHNVYKSTNIIKIYTPAISKRQIALKNEIVSDWYCKWKRDAKIITVVGTLNKQKNISLAIKAVNILVEKSQNYKLLIIGDGDERKSLEKLVDKLNLTNNVKFFGHSSNPLPYMTASDCFVLTSNYEGLPGVLIEALLCECRIVSTDCPTGPREILENGKFGKLIPVNDFAALANAIEASLQMEKPGGLF